MITANNMTLVGYEPAESDFQIKLMEALARATQKYNTSVTLKPNVYSLAPIVISDAILAANCSVTELCSVPSVIKNTKIQMNDACYICLTNLTEGEFAVYGIDPIYPEPTTILENAKASEQAIQLTYSGLKTYWLGNTAYVAADLINAALLPAYKKDNGQWTKIAAINPAHVTITENAAVTVALQMTVTADEVLAYIDAMIVAQSPSMQMVSNSAKTIWSTVELFDAVMAKLSKDELYSVRQQPIENEFGNFDSFIYRDIQVIKYEHFSAAIRDLARPVPAAYPLPHRMVLTIGLPTLEFPRPTESSFETDYNAVSKRWEAGTMLTIMQPEPVAADYYVIAY